MTVAGVSTGAALTPFVAMDPVVADASRKVLDRAAAQVDDAANKVGNMRGRYAFTALRHETSAKKSLTESVALVQAVSRTVDGRSNTALSGIANVLQGHVNLVDAGIERIHRGRVTGVDQRWFGDSAQAAQLRDLAARLRSIPLGSDVGEAELRVMDLAQTPATARGRFGGPVASKLAVAGAGAAGVGAFEAAAAAVRMLF